MNIRSTQHTIHIHIHTHRNIRNTQPTQHTTRIHDTCISECTVDIAFVCLVCCSFAFNYFFRKDRKERKKERKRTKTKTKREKRKNKKKRISLLFANSFCFELCVWLQEGAGELRRGEIDATARQVSSGPVFSCVCVCVCVRVCVFPTI